MNKDGSANPPLRDVNCAVRKGEAISVIGPSGTGKSTLPRGGLAIAGLLIPPGTGRR